MLVGYVFQSDLALLLQNFFINYKKESHRGFPSKDLRKRHTNNCKKKLLRAKNVTWLFLQQMVVYGQVLELLAMLFFFGLVALS